MKTTTRRHVLMYYKRFHEDVESGVKHQSIRHLRVREIQPGDWLSHRAWKGKPRGSKHRILREAACSRVEIIQIAVVNGAPVIAIEGRRLNPGQTEDFARADGFPSVAEMTAFWQSHGVRSTYSVRTLIHWKVPT